MNVIKEEVYETLYEISDPLDDTDYIFILKLMLFAHFLRPMLDRASPDIGILEVLDHHPVDLVAEVLYCGPASG